MTEYTDKIATNIEAKNEKKDKKPSNKKTEVENERKRKARKFNKVKSVEQMVFARIIAQKLGMRIADVVQVIEEEQKLTMNYVRQGYKVVKKNYLTIDAKNVKGKDWFCPLNGVTYKLPERMQVYVRVGNGFKDYVSGKKTLPEKMCRFVDEPYILHD
ncbi:MAG: HU family DNA-binding protein [Bacillota bacterium]